MGVMVLLLSSRKASNMGVLLITFKRKNLNKRIFNGCYSYRPGKHRTWECFDELPYHNFVIRYFIKAETMNQASTTLKKGRDQSSKEMQSKSSFESWIRSNSKCLASLVVL
jgi:hypothetical protein